MNNQIKIETADKQELQFLTKAVKGSNETINDIVSGLNDMKIHQKQLIYLNSHLEQQMKWNSERLKLINDLIEVIEPSKGNCDFKSR